MKQYTIIPYSRQIKQVIYNDPATIVFWKDGTKTVVKCQGNDKYSYASGLMHAIIRKIYGEDSRKYSDILDFITTAEEFDKMMEENAVDKKECSTCIGSSDKDFEQSFCHDCIKGIQNHYKRG